MRDDEFPGQRATAYHEAGHAVAAIKCPDGCIKYIDICDRNENNDENGATVASIRDADEAFQLYAGAWAEAHLIASSEAVDIDVVWRFLRSNEDDWTAFQRATGNNVSDTAWTSMQLTLMETGEHPGPEYRPPRAWHERAHGVLALAWDSGEIQALAEQMLARKPRIELTTGQVLIREETRDRWWGLNYRRGSDDGDGLVGPPCRSAGDFSQTNGGAAGD